MATVAAALVDRNEPEALAESVGEDGKLERFSGAGIAIPITIPIPTAPTRQFHVKRKPIQTPRDRSDPSRPHV